MEISVSELVVGFMARLGIRHAFGVPGAHILPVYDRLRDSPVKTVLVKHEQGAAFMAGGYARASGRPAACITTAGPGAINLATGLANAAAERLPVLVVTGETSTYIFGRGGLQESSGEGGSFDQADFFRGITRYHRLVERTDYLGQVLNRAARILLAEDSGPVLLSFPYNVQKETVCAGILDEIDFSPPPAVPRPSIDALVALLAEARHPVIIAGHGCVAAGAGQALSGLAHEFAIPVATSLKGKGALGEDSPLALGCLGVTSTGEAYRHVAEEADLLLFLGTGYNERTSHLWDRRLLAGKRLVQVDRDPNQLGKVFKPDLAIHGDLRQVLPALRDALRQRGVVAKALTGRLGRAAPATDKFALIARLFAELAQRFAGGAQIFDDNIVFAQNHLRISALMRYYPNSGISSLGHALPAAIGARIAEATPTFAILGDGGFQMCAMELMTAVNYRIPLTVLLLNNGSMGLIRKNQAQLYGERYIDCDFINPDFALLARAFGVSHFRVAGESDLGELFAQADFANGINLVEVVVDKNAYPDYLSDR